jgi:hypothetical protein
LVVTRIQSTTWACRGSVITCGVARITPLGVCASMESSGVRAATVILCRFVLRQPGRERGADGAGSDQKYGSHAGIIGEVP